MYKISATNLKHLNSLVPKQSIDLHATESLLIAKTTVSPVFVAIPTVISIIPHRLDHKMTESPTRSPPSSTTTATKVPQEIISEEEMALIDSAFASAAAQFPRNQRSIQSITRLSKRTLLDSMATGSSPDIEDLGRVGWSDSSPLKKRNRGLDSFLHRFRRKRGLSVTDITATVKFSISFSIFNYFFFFGKIKYKLEICVLCLT